LDRNRQPLTGDEIRGCWDGWPTGAGAPSTVPLTMTAARTDAERKPALQFVDVDGVSESVEVVADAVEPLTAPLPPSAEPGWSLWSDLET
jgi:hypothetical protein